MVGWSQTPNSLPVSGNVGIGTISPACKLEVVGNARVTGKIDLDSSLIVRDSAYFEGNTKVEGNFVVSGDAEFLNSVKVEGALYNTAISDSVNSRLVGVDRFGQLIGLNNYYLGGLVYSNSCIPLTDNNNSPLGGVIPVWSSNPGPPGQTDYGVLFTGTPCGAKVGIQTSNPLQELHVNGNGLFSQSLWVGSIGFNPNDQHLFHVDGGNLQPGQLLSYFSGLTREVVIDESGDVGIGLINPTASFHLQVTEGDNYAGKVENLSNIGGGALYVSSASSDYSQKIYNSSSNGNGLLIKVNSNSGDDSNILTCESSSSTHGQIDSKVFEVGANGVTYAREIIVDLNLWPDYVFDEDYKLMALDSLERFIYKYHRLPGVQEEKEMLEKGYNVSEIGIMQMKKIEEIMLYLILLQKENVDLHKELEEIRNDLKKD